MPFCFQDHGPSLSLGLHLAMHRIRNVGRRLDSLQLNTRHAGSPLVGGIVQDDPELTVDQFTRGEGFVESQVSDPISEVGLVQLGGRQIEVGHIVGNLDRVGDLVVDDRIHFDNNVVLGNDLLRRYVDNLLAHVHFQESVQKRHDQCEAAADGSLISSQALDQSFLSGPHDPQARGRDDENKDNEENKDDNKTKIHFLTLLDRGDHQARPVHGDHLHLQACCNRLSASALRTPLVLTQSHSTGVFIGIDVLQDLAFFAHEAIGTDAGLLFSGDPLRKGPGDQEQSQRQGDERNQLPGGSDAEQGDAGSNARRHAKPEQEKSCRENLPGQENSSHDDPQPQVTPFHFYFSIC